MRGPYGGKYYAEVSESTRYVGIETISVHQFETEKDRDKFINEYNMVLLTHNGIVPNVYRMAEPASLYVISEFLTGKYGEHQRHTKSKYIHFIMINHSNTWQVHTQSMAICSITEIDDIR